jgi:hypothetical protein
MAVSISTKQSVLWDQIQYSGKPADFAWVLPVKPGAVLQISNDAWFETLDATTNTRVLPAQLACQNQFNNGFSSPNRGCSGFGCGSAAEDAELASGGAVPNAEPPPVQVIHEGTVGPYATQTLKANVPGALTTWLQSNGYAIATSEQPLIDAYTSEGFDFIALRLKPDAGVQQMKPVRVVTQGASPALPLRMVGVGTGANVAITLFVIGESRWEAGNFPNTTVDPANLEWNFQAQSSNYSALRNAALAEANFTSWLTSYAKQHTLFEPASIASGGQAIYTLTNGQSATTIAQALFRQGLANGEAQSCNSDFAATALSKNEVVNPCDATGQNCMTVGQEQIDARIFACGKLDDLAVAMTGLHPSDVWLTRLEANLSHDALKTDLTLATKQADQTEHENWITAQKKVNPPCTDATTASILPLLPKGLGGARSTNASSASRVSRSTKMLALSMLVVALVMLRRARRPKPAIPARVSVRQRGTHGH